LFAALLLLAFACRGEPAPPPVATPASAALDAMATAPTPADAQAVAAATPPEAPRSPPSVVTPLPELCRKACANTLRIVGAELPADAAPAIRAELERSLGAPCHARCMQRASVTSAQCVAAATTALELAECR